MALETTFKYCGKVNGEPDWHIGSHLHPEHHEFIVVVKGVIEVEICDRKIRAEAGNALIYPAGLRHEENASDNLPLETFYIGIATQGRPANHIDLGPIFDINGRLRILSQWMYDLSNLRLSRDIRMLDNIAFSFIHELDYLKEPAEPDFMQLAKRYIEKNIGNSIELPDIAKASELSVSRFAHAFKKLTGLAPVEYLRRRRMEYARTLILSTSLPLKEIAEKCGCTDQYIFSKIFRRVMGVPPGSLRK